MIRTRWSSPDRRRGAGAIAVGIVLSVAVVGVALAAPDPYRPQQWNVERVGASSAWAEAAGRGQVIAILDSGVDLEHPDLVDRFLRDADGKVIGRDIVDDDAVPEDPLGHGTMVAGIAAATHDNGLGIAGIAPAASLLPVRVLDSEGSGTTADVSEGIRWAVRHGATVINLSLESATSGDGDSLLGSGTVAAPVEAVEWAWRHGVVVVAAAGNSGNGFTDYPRSSPVVLVGATDRDNQRTDFSDAGRDDLLMAPGVDIVSTWCRRAGDERCRAKVHTYGIASGTSFAAPHVAAGVAILRSAGMGKAAAVRRLRRTARDLGAPGRDPETGYGLIDLVSAVNTGPGPASPSPTGSASPSPTRSPSPTATSTSRPSPSPEPRQSTRAPTAPARTSAPPATPTAPATSPATSAPTSPTPDPTPTATESVSAVPSPEPTPVATTPTPTDADATPAALAQPDQGERVLWIAVSLLLMAATAVLVARTWVHR